MDFSQIAFMALIILLYTFQNFFSKTFSLSYPGKNSDATPVLTIAGGLTVAVVTFFFAKCSFSAQFMTVILGLVNALALYGYNFLLVKASSKGPYSVLLVFAIVGGIVLPSAVKWIAYGENMTGPAMCFLVLVIVSVYLMSIKPKDENISVTNKITPSFLIMATAFGLCNGAYATIITVQQEITGPSEKEELIIITFLTGAVISLVTLLCKKANFRQAAKQTKASAASLITYALSAAFAVNLLVIAMLLGINVGTLYTVQNAGVMLVSVVFSILFFKEKLTRVNVVGCALMAIGLIGIVVFEKSGFSQMGETLSNLIK